LILSNGAMDIEKTALVVEDRNTSDDTTVSPEESVVVPDDRGLIQDPLKQRKIKEIEVACERRDTTQLRRLAESAGGFLSDHVRRRACEDLRVIAAIQVHG
jgi:hypothetical protein